MIQNRTSYWTGIYTRMSREGTALRAKRWLTKRPPFQLGGGDKYDQEIMESYQNQNIQDTVISSILGNETAGGVISSYGSCCTWRWRFGQISRMYERVLSPGHFSVTNRDLSQGTGIKGSSAHYPLRCTIIIREKKKCRMVPGSLTNKRSDAHFFRLKIQNIFILKPWNSTVTAPYTLLSMTTVTQTPSTF